MWRKLATRLNSRMQQGETSLAGLSPFAGRVVHPLVLVAAAAAVAWQLRQQAASSVSVTAGLVHESRGSSIALQGAPPAACLVIHCWTSGRGGCCHGWAWQSSAANRWQHWLVAASPVNDSKGVAQQVALPAAMASLVTFWNGRLLPSRDSS